MACDFLEHPRRIRTEIRKAEAELECLRVSMLPSAVRYDQDKVMSSPSDPMPTYAAKVDDLQRRIKELQAEYLKAEEAIMDAVSGLPYLEQEVIVLRYVAQYSWKRVAYEMGKGQNWIFKIHKRAVKNLEKKLSTI